jgi:hypothetical protein
MDKNLIPEDDALKNRAPIDVGPSKSDYHRLFAGLSIFLLGTFLGIYLVPQIFSTYHWLTLLVGMLISDAYAAYLFYFDFSRLRAFLLHYFTGFGFILLVSFVFGADMATNFSWIPGIDRLIQVTPIIASFFSILRTHLVGAEPDLIVGRKNFSE